MCAFSGLRQEALTRATSVWEAAGGRGESEKQRPECKFRLTHMVCWDGSLCVIPRALSGLWRMELLAWGSSPELGGGWGLGL